MHKRSSIVFERIPGFQITVYVSPNERALAASSWLFGSIGRLGKLDAGRLTRSRSIRPQSRLHRRDPGPRHSRVDRP
jgi:alpha/beta hydrolase family protein DUF900